MDYGNLLKRAWTIMWTHKYLIALGVLATLGNGGFSSSGSQYNVSEEDFQSLPDFLPQPDLSRLSSSIGAAELAIIAVIIGVLLVVFLVIWALSQIAHGALIAGVDMIETGRDSSLGIAWQAGWRRGWTLIGIGLVPLIPTLFVAGAVLAGGVLFLGLGAAFGRGFDPSLAGGGAIAIVLALLCIILPVLLVVGFLCNLAYRACMLEETGVWASYRRGWQVLRDNLGEVVLIAVLALVIGVGLFIVLLFPTVIMALCCVLWPLLLLIQGAIAAYFSTVWTLAWREWTGAQPAAAPIIAP